MTKTFRVMNNVQIEDYGKAKIIELISDMEERLFIRVHSWDVTGQHKDLDAIVAGNVICELREKRTYERMKGQRYTCPRCGGLFPADLFSEHTAECLSDQNFVKSKR